MSHMRPNPDQLLAQVQAVEQKQARGKLKLFFGAAPGVGKTYAMLESARKAAKEGADVLVGYIEPHARPETQSLVLGLDVLNRREVEYRGAQVFEFDLSAALQRKPGLILVDELAHTNALGSSHTKRWQDVIELLDAGIDVYSTLNVQHLESLNDVIAQITGVAVRETVPDWVFENADEIELVDLAPDDLLERLRDGKIYLPEQAQRAISHFFQKGNLIALRELALRQSAQRVDAQMVEFRRENAIEQTWPAAERLLVCVSSSPGSAKLVRATRRMAASLKASWVAVHVETPASMKMSADDRQRLTRNLRLAEQLGGETAMISGSKLVDAVIAYARNRNVSKIMVGKPQQPRWRDLLRGPFVYELARRCGDIDVYIISGDQDTETPRSVAPRVGKSLAWGYAWATIAVAICTAISLTLDRLSSSDGKIVNMVMVYLLGVVAVSLRLGRGPSMLTSLAGVIAFDFFFIAPRLTFAVQDTQYIFTFVVMFVTGVVISSLVARLAAQAALAQRGEQRTMSLYGMSREFAAIQARETIVAVAMRHLAQAVDGQVCLLLPNGSKQLETQRPEYKGFEPSQHDQGVARWVFDHRQPAGLGTDTLPGATALYLPLATSRGSVGVLGIQPAKSAAPLDIDQSHLLEALAGLIALALERSELSQQAEQRRMLIETERLRNSLLSAVSHDLRTPLAAIAGASSTLLDADQSLSADIRRELTTSIYEETHRLSRLVANLLDMTRLEGGGMVANKEWQPVEEIVGVVIRRFAAYAAKHPIDTQLAAELPLVPFDDVLMQQVLINLVENAMKFSPPFAPVTISAAASKTDITVSVSDRGPGVTPGEETRLFEKFYRSQGAPGRSGVGLGLAICRGIVQLHGGRIWVENQPAGGAKFSFTLPIVGRPPAVPPEAAGE